MPRANSVGRSLPAATRLHGPGSVTRPWNGWFRMLLNVRLSIAHPNSPAASSVAIRQRILTVLPAYVVPRLTLTVVKLGYAAFVLTYAERPLSGLFEPVNSVPP